MWIFIALSLLGCCFGFIPQSSRFIRVTERSMSASEANNTKPVPLYDVPNLNNNALKYEFEESQRNIVRIPTRPEDLAENLPADSGNREMSYNSVKLSS